MSELIKFRDIKLEAGVLMIRPEKEDIGKAMALVRKHKNRLYDLEVKEHRKKRSLDANAYAWVLINKLAEVMRIGPEEVYRQAIQEISGNNEIMPIKEAAVEQFKIAWEKHGIGWICKDMGRSRIPGYHNLMVYYGSSVYTVQQMNMLIENLVQDCKALDIEVLSERERSLLLEEWSKKEYA